jgi:hypothetical protein
MLPLTMRLRLEAARCQTLGHYARQAGHTIFNFLKKPVYRLSLPVFLTTNPNQHRQEMVRGKAWLNTLEAHETAHQEPGPDKYDQRQRQFRNNQQAAQPVPPQAQPTPSSSSMPTKLERCIQIDFL